MSATESPISTLIIDAIKIVSASTAATAMSLNALPPSQAYLCLG
jgi:hypothetical protein